MPTVPAGSADAVTVSGDVAPRLRCPDSCSRVFRRVRHLHGEVGVAAAVGVPVMAPVDALSVNPAGKPLAIDQVYGAVPPVAARVAV